MDLLFAGLTCNVMMRISVLRTDVVMKSAHCVPAWSHFTLVSRLGPLHRHLLSARLHNNLATFNTLWGNQNIFLANQETPDFWKLASETANPELICLRELLEFKSDWSYAVFKGRHTLPLMSRIDLERHIVQRIHGNFYFTDQLTKSLFLGAAFKTPRKDGYSYM